VTPVGASILERAGEQVGQYLPRLGGALVLLVAGLLLAYLVGRLIRRVLRSLGADDMAERRGVHDALEQAGLGRSLSSVIAAAVRWAVIAIVVFAVIALLGPLFLAESLNRAVLFLPNVLVAAALILVGVVLGSVARVAAERSATQMNLTLPLGVLAQVVIVAVFAVTAAAQLGVSTAILTGLLGIVLAGAVATVAIAFGLGGRDAARAVSAGRYVRESLHIGDVITVAGRRGRIAALDLTATVLEDADGALIRIPNRLVLDSVVVVEPVVEGMEPGSSPDPAAGG
jgi:small-conductance mechanosensitive channel